MPRGGSQRGQCRYDADRGCGDPPAFSDALEHGDPFVGLYVTIKYLHAGFEESVAQHCQTVVRRRQSHCHVLPESATRNFGSEWDTVSQTGLNRKLRPSLRPQNGTQFPPGQPSSPFRHSEARISSSVHRKYMNRCSMYANLPACFPSKNFATPKTQSRQGFSCPTVGT